MALTGKQRIFIAEYVSDFNATRAAIAAGYSKNSAADIGYENLRKPDIAEAIKRTIDDRCMTEGEVLIRLAEHARGSVDDFVTFSEGVKLPILDMSKAHKNGKMHLLKKLKYTDQGGVEFELYDAQSALVLIGKVHKLFTEKSEVSGPDGGPLRILLDR